MTVSLLAPTYGSVIGSLVTHPPESGHDMAALGRSLGGRPVNGEPQGTPLVNSDIVVRSGERTDEDLAAHATAYAARNWEVLPLRGKIPLIPRRDGGRGVLDATSDLSKVSEWWDRWPDANVGGRVPSGLVVIDIDPRSGGLESWGELVAQNHDIVTLAAWSGRGDGGRHLFLRNPGGRLRGSIGQGLDVKTHAGYTVLPPSIHPESHKPYRWDDVSVPIVAPPAWLIELLSKRPAIPQVPRSRRGIYTGDSIADWYTVMHTWEDVLAPHGWMLVAGDGDGDGSKWRHPTSTSAEPASIKHGCLFVYSPNTPFIQTGAQDPHGYTRFAAFAILDHCGDRSAAARAARTMREAAR